LEGIAAIVADAFIAIAAGVLDLFVRIVVASIRPWRYLLSRSFRERTNQQFIGKNLFIKGWFLFWGSIVAFLSLVVMGAIIWFFVSLFHEPEPGAKQKTIQGIENIIFERFKR
jgi:hypothetical protein